MITRATSWLKRRAKMLLGTTETMCSRCWTNTYAHLRSAARASDACIVMLHAGVDIDSLDECREALAKHLPSSEALLSVSCESSLRSLMRFTAGRDEQLRAVMSRNQRVALLAVTKMPWRPTSFLIYLAVKKRLKPKQVLFRADSCLVTEDITRCLALKAIKSRALPVLLLIRLWAKLLSALRAKRIDAKAKILVTLAGHLGDVIMSTPCLRALRREFSEAHIVVVVHSEAAREILKDCPYINELFVAEIRCGLRKRLRLAVQLASYHFNWSISPIPSGFSDTTSSTYVPYAAGIGRRYGPRTTFQMAPFFAPFSHPVDMGQKLGWAEWFIGAVRSLGVEPDGIHTECFVSADSRQAVHDFLGADEGRPIVVVHTGGQERTERRWPAEKYAQLIDEMQEDQPMRVLLTGTIEAGELELAQEVASRCTRPAEVVVGEFSLSEMIALVERADLVVTNDTAPLHIALALSAPVVALFGPTSPEEILGPNPSENCRVLRPPLNCPPKDQCPIYLAAGKRRQILQSTCISRSSVCVDALPVSTAVAAVRDLIGKQSRWVRFAHQQDDTLEVDVRVNCEESEDL